MKSQEKVWYSAKELEKLDLPEMPKLATNITRKALKESWYKRDAVGTKGGGYEYHISSFPKKAQMSLGFKDAIEAYREDLQLSLKEKDVAPIVDIPQSYELANLRISMITSFSSINVSAGFGSFNEGVTKPDGKEPYSDTLLQSLRVIPEKCAVFWANGDSMTPTIEDGDQLLVDLSKNEIKGGDKIYLVQNGESVWVKRVKMKWDGVELVSDNKEEYPQSKLLQKKPKISKSLGK